MENYKIKLEKFYSSENILNVPLEKYCMHSDSCWKGIEDRGRIVETSETESNLEHSNLYIPWIGEKYDKLKLVILGINMNDCGGYDAEESLALSAKDAILQGQKRINFGNHDYHGTMFWHRVAAYAVAFMESAGIIKPNWQDDDFPSKEDISLAFEYFAITNSIKCSPKSTKDSKDRSKPTGAMWNNCPSYILKKELETLAPEKILLTGISDNANYFNNKVLDQPCNLIKLENIKHGIGLLNGKKIEIFVVPHPSIRTSVKIMYSLVDALRLSKKEM